jgi:hypothetical protein
MGSFSVSEQCPEIPYCRKAPMLRLAPSGKAAAIGLSRAWCRPARGARRYFVLLRPDGLSLALIVEDAAAVAGVLIFAFLGFLISRLLRF